ncbi:MAG TPA: hypothetical protein VJ596_12230 [Gemmatimonadaceae bacterium]|nr:hypothetical protein [Gemmatimonadaceae bacterium]
MPTNTKSAAETSTTVPVACVAGAIAPEERQGHFALIARLFREDVRERRTIAGGYGYRFEPQMLDDVARFVSNERRCCPFLRFSIELAPDDGPLWLHLVGPVGTREFLDAELASGAA